MIDEYTRLRERMVSEQILKRGVCQARTITAMKKIPRHMFVPTRSVLDAYEDHPLPVDDGQTISQPYIVAYMTEILDIKKSDRILEIGTGSGYQTAILAELSDYVYTIEQSKVLADQAKAILKSLGYYHVKFIHKDGFSGWSEEAPFNKIIVTCAVSKVPQSFLDQLNEKSSKMIIPVDQPDADFQYLTLIEKKEGSVFSKNVMAARFVPMINPKGGDY